jgi:hypothetical protein
MSGAAASATVSKFSSFMNHPAGEHPNFHIKTHSHLQQTCRTKDCVFLGAYDEVVFGRCRCKRSHPSRRQAEHVPKPRYASAPSFLRIIPNSCSSYCHWIYMGAIFICDHSRQLQFGSSTQHIFQLCSFVDTKSLQVNFFVGLSGVTQLGRIAQ